ncbi:HNH endonuclease [Thalassospira sp. MCCC 1A01428]|uniref:HNH endonuclease n=1 Tax=Thalassospira sp. MCCC 1A01428 TaxID=1470575 RepID=UPI000A1E4C26|nr:HNH endonuclease [Thalassospira sp. MCCC 1A01428]OSQ35034.1 hypothetical protein THS27_24815 [Thalassospira sp. MCCC 1A01428]
MPALPRKPCAFARCGRLTEPGQRHCQLHKRERQVRQDKERGTAANRGYGYKWQKARVGFLKHHPLCCRCEQAGLVVAAAVVDHIKPHRGDMVLFWDRANWQSLCTACHNTKTAKEDGGFGRRLT